MELVFAKFAVDLKYFCSEFDPHLLIPATLSLSGEADEFALTAFEPTEFESTESIFDLFFQGDF